MTNQIDIQPNIVLEVRGVRVILDERVADAFGTETKRVNEARSRNADRFDQRHAFQLDDEETAFLRSQTATAKKRGGRRTNPWVYSVKGVARLATILDTPQARASTDMIIDTFLEVQRQIAEGRSQIAIAQPSKYLPSPEQTAQVSNFRARKRFGSWRNQQVPTMMTKKTNRPYPYSSATSLRELRGDGREGH